MRAMASQFLSPPLSKIPKIADLEVQPVDDGIANASAGNKTF
jgi:hypothetical protein